MNVVEAVSFLAGFFIGVGSTLLFLFLGLSGDD